MNRVFQLILSLLILAYVSPAIAHHSLSHFDSKQIVAYRGVVTDFRYENPHPIIEAIVPGENGFESWLFEMKAALDLSKQGWVDDSVVPGDLVTFYANPLRKQERNHAFAEFVQLESGKWLVATPRVFQRYMEDHPETMSSSSVTEASSDFSGVWRRTGPVDLSLSSLDLTERGKVLAERFEPTLDPLQFCQPGGFPRYLLDGFAMRISYSDPETLLFEKEFAERRNISLGQDQNGVGEVASGRRTIGSVAGSGSDRLLVIESFGFAAQSWGILPGLDSSAGLKVNETYRLSKDGMRLAGMVRIEDPEYLATPVVLEMAWKKVPDYPFTDNPCTETASG